MPMMNLAKKILQFAPSTGSSGGSNSGNTIGNILDNL
jgi:hypothetical protein